MNDACSISVLCMGVHEVSASSWLHCNSGTCSDVDLDCNVQHSSCVVTNNVHSPSFLLNSSFLHGETRNLTILILFAETVNTFLNDFTLYLGGISWYLTPSVPDARLVLSAFFIWIGLGGHQIHHALVCCWCLSATTCKVTPGGG